MNTETYMLVFRGQLVDGFSVDQAKENLRELYKISHDKIEQLFALSSVVVKKNLTHELAEKIQQQLHKRGIVTVILPMADGTSVAHPVSNQADEAVVSRAVPPAPAVSSAAAASVADGEQGVRDLGFRFLGQGGEYFRIWIVNILLTILTLGIYSAWAKVRNHRYFYGNTRLNEHSFEYLASPIAILKGRVIAVAFLIAYLLSEQFMPLLSIVLFGIFLAVLPWLVCRAMAFRNYHTRYRNIRFGFDGKYMDALKAFIGWPLAGMLTLGILFPYAVYRQKRFLVEHSRYGTQHFVPDFDIKSFYLIYLAAIGMVVAGVVLMFIPVIGPLFLMVAYLLAFAYITANTSNLVYNESTLELHGFDSRLRFDRLAFLYFTNALLILVTLGLAYPWAKVRLARYRAECLSLVAVGSLDTFVAAEDKRTSALGEEIGEAFDVDIGL